jgi:hypothetical protein
MARKRPAAERASSTLSASSMVDTEEGQRTQELDGRLEELLTRANQGDARAAADLLAACRAVPHLWEQLSVLTRHAERAWIDLVAPDRPHNRVARQVLAQDLARKRRQAAGAAPSPLEGLLAERIALHWLAVEFAEAEYARKVKQGMSFKEGEYYAKRCEQANRQLLRAIEALARVRRLLVPTLQVNIADQQINLVN